ncbi:hypothetical protein B0H10DRAFT_2003939 [Mycena sp. CBHHK59/15]|nr:hypothetical protein B0H10DRAFT_2003939 [Mycena sp. CBHHK59/15]
MPKATRKPKPKKMTVRVSEPPIGWRFDLRVGAPRNPNGTAILVKVDMSGPGLRDSDPLVVSDLEPDTPVTTQTWQTTPSTSHHSYATGSVHQLNANTHPANLLVGGITLSGNRDCESHIYCCSICQQLKSHPVSTVCGHTFCYVCIHHALDTSFKCPICSSMIHHPPHRVHNFEESLAASYPTQPDNTKVDWATAWKGLKFPKQT